jgi:hypothetical protein
MSIDDLQAQLRGALDQQLGALKSHYEQAIEHARTEAEATAARDLEAKLSAAQNAWETKVQSHITAIKTEADQQVEREVAAARAEADQQFQAQVASIRVENEQVLHQQVDALRAHVEQQLQTRGTAIREEAERQTQQKLAAIRAELEQASQSQVAAVRAEAEAQAQARLDAARAEAERDTEQKLAAAGADAQTRAEEQIAAARAELEELALTRVAAARAEAEQRVQAQLEAARQGAADAAEKLREDLEKSTDQAVATARRSAALELESAQRKAEKDLDAERARLTAEIEAEKQRGRGEVDALRTKLQGEIATARQAAAKEAVAAATANARPAAPPVVVSTAAFERVAAGIRTLDAAQTLSQALEALVSHAAGIAGRSALFVINGDRLKAWKASAIPEVDVHTVESSIGGKDLLGRAIQGGQPIVSTPSLPAPPFARLSADRPALAVPVMIGGRAVAVLYADAGASATPPAEWLASVDLLTRHAASVMALRTAMRTFDALAGTPNAGNGDAVNEEAARRFAKLLVSEIKLYNEVAVRTGRQQRDLLQRLRAEIDRAQRLYEERVPAAVSARQTYFQQELVQTLADGDATLLGN